MTKLQLLLLTIVSLDSTEIKKEKEDEEGERFSFRFSIQKLISLIYNFELISCEKFINLERITDIYIQKWNDVF